MIRKLSAVFILLLALAASGLFIYRFYILKYSVEKLIRNALPDYVQIEKIRFEPERGSLVFENFRLVNPGGFSYQYLIEIASISFKYRLMGRSVLDGFELLEPEFNAPALTLERLPDGKTNLQAMSDKIKEAASAQSSVTTVSAVSEPEKKTGLFSKIMAGKKLPDILKLPENFYVRGGKIIFIDKSFADRTVMFAFENIDSNLTLKLDDTYSKIMWVASEGKANMNGNKEETVKWVISLDPTRPKLTMSNRFDVAGLSIKNFEPYYDKYSPIVFTKGKFSGNLIFDFDNGNIGSSNEVRLSDLLFWVKPGYENAGFWQTSVPDMVKYFTSSSGDVIFDFKIKGDIKDPQFFLGPISKNAMANMAVDKVSSVITRVAGKAADAAGVSGEGGAINEKAKEYIELFKNMIKKE